jgi:hypothetical protein
MDNLGRKGAAILRLFVVIVLNTLLVILNLALNLTLMIPSRFWLLVELRVFTLLNICVKRPYAMSTVANFFTLMAFG